MRDTRKLLRNASRAIGDAIGNLGHGSEEMERLSQELEKALEDVEVQSSTLDGLLDANLDAPANEEAAEAILRQAREMASELPSAARTPAVVDADQDLEARFRRLANY